ncbi:MAG: MFS transporter [Janthinobacterium lividum]
MNIQTAPLGALDHDEIVASTSRKVITVAAAWIILVLSLLDRLAWSNVAVTVSDDLAIPLAALGVFVTCFFAGSMLSNAASGFITDRLGPRKMLAIMGLLLGAMTFCFSMTRSVTTGMLIQAAMGLLAGADLAACIKLVSSWFPARARAKAVGLAMTSFPVGVTLANAIVPSLAKHASWQTVYQTFGVATMLFAMICFAVLRDGPANTRAVARAPGSVVGQLLRNRNLVLLAIAGFGGDWGLWGFSFLVNAFMVKSQGLSPVVAGFVTMIFGLTAILANPLGGILSDWFRGMRKRVAAGFFLMFAVLLVIFGNLHGVVALRIGAFLLGIAAFSWGAVALTMISEAAPRAHVAAASGLSNAVWQAGGLAVPLVVGYAYATTHSFVLALTLLALGPLLGMIAVLAVDARAQPEDAALPTAHAGLSHAASPQ